ncbi:MAG: cytidine deaminase [Bacteriovoracaceae bacterium]|jgi:dCMP deaminase|nr:cytidine deaminase [Bacteriovoracaceae bacterium]
MEKLEITQSKNFVSVDTKLTWDDYFMLQAMMASFKSKDPNTAVGCVFVDQNHHQLTMGYNGQVAGIDETQIPWGNDRSEPYVFQKYGYVVHAEANAILHSKSKLEGSRCYVTLFPCNECAKMIATLKLSEVIFLSDKYTGTQDNIISKRILDLAGVKYKKHEVSPKLISGLGDHFSELLEHI